MDCKEIEEMIKDYYEKKENLFLNEIFKEQFMFRDMAIKFFIEATILLQLKTSEEIYKFFLVDGDIKKLESYIKYNILKDKHKTMETFFKLPDEGKLSIFMYIQKSLIDYEKESKNEVSAVKTFEEELKYYSRDIATIEGKKNYFADFLRRNIFTQGNEYDSLIIDFISTFSTGFNGDAFSEIYILSYFMPEGEVDAIKSYSKFDYYLESKNQSLIRFLNQETSIKLKLYIYIQNSIKIYFNRIGIVSYLNNYRLTDNFYETIVSSCSDAFEKGFENFVNKIKNVFVGNLLQVDWNTKIIKNYKYLLDGYEVEFKNTIINNLPLYTGLACLRMFFVGLMVATPLICNDKPIDNIEQVAINAVSEIINVHSEARKEALKGVLKELLIEGDLNNERSYKAYSKYNKKQFTNFKKIFSFKKDMKLKAFQSVNRTILSLYKNMLSPKERINKALKNNLVNVDISDPFWDAMALNFMTASIVYELEDLYIKKTNRDMMKYFLADGKDSDIKSYKKYEHFIKYQDQDINAVLTLNEKAKLSVFKRINDIAKNFLMGK